MRQFAIAVVAAAVALAAVIAVAAILGASPGDILGGIARGSLGSLDALSETLLKTTPLLLTGLSIAVAFRAGVWNIGAEGQFLAGALAAYLVVRAFPEGRLAMVAALLAACAGGAAWGAFASFMRIWRNAPEVLTTILMNFIAYHLLGYAVNGPLRESAGRYPQTDSVPLGSQLPGIGTSRLHVGIAIAVMLCGVIYWLLFRTSEGLRLRAVGYNRSAARFAGIDVAAQSLRAMAVSAALAGLAGAIELLGVTNRLFERFAAGYGYSGIAVALLAQLHPVAMIASAFFFGCMSAGAAELQRASGISASVATLGQAVVILAIVILGSPAVDQTASRLWRRRPRLPGGPAGQDGSSAPEQQPCS
jgi:ABC-type uncharacterized transport system permease subunit